ncbi:MAG TPA: hypothetical protein VE377_20445 [Candidatus Dormibacteraeota bacterium]|nr:hypothetical protein [Candidatus Dormibacteraeota bacterium]
MASETSSSPPLRFPTWQRAYSAVLTEADTRALFKLVEIAEAAILTRRASLEGDPNHHSEREAIDDAIAILREVKKKRLRFP